MAVFRATFCPKAVVVGNQGAVFHGPAMSGLDELTTSGTADNVEESSSEWTAPGNGFVAMVCTGAVWVSVGSAPTAAVGTDLFLKADERVVISVQADDKISVIDDS